LQSTENCGAQVYPCVPGHEIVGRVAILGPQAKKFKIGDMVAVGPVIDSCRNCPSCKEGLQNYCENGHTEAYNGNVRFPNKENVTHGGYSESIVVNEDYVFRLPAGFNPASAAPLVCAGATMWSPLKHWKVGKGTSVAIVGFGGLGHIGTKLAKALGAQVTVVTSDPQKKREDAIKCGAVAVIDSTDQKVVAASKYLFDFMISTVPVSHDIMPYVDMLKRDGTLCIIGAIAPIKSIDMSHLTFDRKSIASSVIAPPTETQELLDFCAAHDIKPDIKIISVDSIADAYSDLHDGDVSYRFVLDVTSMRNTNNRSNK
jgi:uncharacterized zinc-type alcohol dehydrogenase-like protein